MFNVLIDTCVWLDLAQDQKQTPLLLVVENMVEAGRLRLLVPRIVLEEFRKNRTRVAKTSARGLATQFQQVKEAVNKAGGNENRKKELLAQLDDVNHRIPIIGGAAEGALERIEKLLKSVTIIETSDGFLPTLPGDGCILDAWFRAPANRFPQEQACWCAFSLH